MSRTMSNQPSSSKRRRIYHEPGYDMAAARMSPVPTASTTTAYPGYSVVPPPPTPPFSAAAPTPFLPVLCPRWQPLDGHLRLPTTFRALVKDSNGALFNLPMQPSNVPCSVSSSLDLSHALIRCRVEAVNHALQTQSQPRRGVADFDLVSESWFVICYTLDAKGKGTWSTVAMATLGWTGVMRKLCVMVGARTLEKVETDGVKGFEMWLEFRPRYR
ncbi:hypothetical protein LTR37_018221 [Vermiconidia calcicola]|uniref:Uncharacterized protein n=1 Tax=Vermiconidia calcicola TaxID=1690605 RepID=A0ACC3MJ53_9PEZI|nr:hypothetical protein LTR37_018221 [Vermiconidia calcicola]